MIEKLSEIQNLYVKLHALREVFLFYKCAKYLPLLIISKQL
jgi:hypothetical protein